jgi:hypothetical protein
MCVPKALSVESGGNEKGNGCRSTVGVKRQDPSTMLGTDLRHNLQGAQ